MKVADAFRDAVDGVNGVCDAVDRIGCIAKSVLEFEMSSVAVAL